MVCSHSPPEVYQAERFRANTSSLGGMDTGPGFVFNLGGGPGIRVHQFGGGRPRRRPATAVPPGSEGQQNLSSAFANLLPLLFLFVLPLLSSLFSGSTTSTSAGPNLVFETPRAPNTMKRVSSRIKIDYYVDPKDVADFTPKKWRSLDQSAENQYVHVTNTRCQTEKYKQKQAMEEAQGWFSVDMEAMQRARSMELKNCNKLKKLGLDVYGA